MSKRALGKGLSAFFPATDANTGKSVPSSAKQPGEAETALKVVALPIADILTNPLQPRRAFAEEKLAELADSIRIHGVVQPVVVTKTPEGYRLVVGERRYRAATMAGLTEIPAIVREYAEREVLEVALIENLHREDLNPIEEAQAYAYLLSEHGMTHEQLSERLGRSRSAVSNTMRLLGLGDEIRADLISGALSPGHGRAVLPIADERQRLSVWNRVKREELTVRQTEQLVSRIISGDPGPKPAPKPQSALSADWEELVHHLGMRLGTEIRIKPSRTGNGKGKIELRYRNAKQLDQVMELFISMGEQMSPE